MSTQRNQKTLEETINTPQQSIATNEDQLAKFTKQRDRAKNPAIKKRWQDLITQVETKIQIAKTGINNLEQPKAMLNSLKTKASELKEAKHNKLQKKIRSKKLKSKSAQKQVEEAAASSQAAATTTSQTSKTSEITTPSAIATTEPTATAPITPGAGNALGKIAVGIGAAALSAAALGTGMSAAVAGAAIVGASKAVGEAAITAATETKKTGFFASLIAPLVAFWNSLFSAEAPKSPNVSPVSSADAASFTPANVANAPSNQADISSNLTNESSIDAKPTPAIDLEWTAEDEKAFQELNKELDNSPIEDTAFETELREDTAFDADLQETNDLLAETDALLAETAKLAPAPENDGTTLTNDERTAYNQIMQEAENEVNQEAPTAADIEYDREFQKLTDASDRLDAKLDAAGEMIDNALDNDDISDEAVNDVLKELNITPKPTPGQRWAKTAEEEQNTQAPSNKAPTPER